MKRPFIFFALAGLAAIITSLVVYSALKKKDAEVNKALLKTVEIVVAARDLPLGTKLDAGAVRMTRWPRDSMPPGAVTDVKAVLGNVVKTPLVENEPVVSSRLFSGDVSSGVLPLLIPPNMRAMSVAVDEVSDIAGFVLPHARVDVLVALSQHDGAGGAGSQSKIVLENVEVLAVAQTVEHKDKPQIEKVVTLLVTPEEAERLALASREGSLRLALRNYGDGKIVMTQGSSVKNLLAAFNIGAPTQVAKAHGTAPVVHKAPPVEVEIMRDGQSRDAVRFANDGREIGQAADSRRKPGVLAPQAKKQESAEPYPEASAGEPAKPDAGADKTAGFGGPDAKTIEVR